MAAESRSIAIACGEAALFLTPPSIPHPPLHQHHHSITLVISGQPQIHGTLMRTKQEYIKGIEWGSGMGEWEGWGCRGVHLFEISVDPLPFCWLTATFWALSVEHLAL